MIDASLRRHVWARAGERCEYCRLPQASAPVVRFQIEHIRAKQHRGETVAENLALACPRCNAFKGPNLTAIDPESGQIALIFNPRMQEWTEHFSLVGNEIIGLTPVGRATAALLQMNDEDRVAVRAALLERGEFTP